MSADKRGDLATHKWTRNQKRLVPVPVAAEGIEGDDNRIEKYRTELNSVGPIRKKNQRKDTAQHGEKQECQYCNTRDRGRPCEARVIRKSRLVIAHSERKISERIL
jgi:hypothetical protein